MNIFIICNIRSATEKYKKKLETYTALLEKTGNRVHLPHRDTDQKTDSVEICRQNREAIYKADEIHIFYTTESTGIHFDLGIAFGLGKKIKIIENIEVTKEKSFGNLIRGWEAVTKDKVQRSYYPET